MFVFSFPVQIVMVVLGLIVIGALLWFVFGNEKTDLNELVYKPIQIEVGQYVQAAEVIYKVDDSKPQLEFKITQNQVVLFMFLQGARQAKSQKINKSTVVYQNVFDNVDVKFGSYENRLKEDIILKNQEAPKSFTYDLSQTFANTDNFELDTLQGIFVFLKDKRTGEELIMLEMPKAQDAQGRFIAYHYRLSGKKLILEPHQAYDFSKFAYPITIDPPVTVRKYDEVLVKLGQNGDDSPSTEKDGDVITIKPAGWPWGKQERRDFVIVRTPKLTKEQRNKFIQRTKQGAVRYAIDYTKIASKEQLKVIRNYNKENPILDATNLPLEQIIQKKPDALSSIIPQNRRLSSSIRSQRPFWEKLASKLVEPVRAAGTITKTIGTASRDYSTITAWETGEQGDLVTLQEIHKGEMYNDSIFDEQVTIDGSTTNSSYYMWLTVAAGERHNGTAGSGARIVASSSYTPFTVYDDGVFEWIEIDMNSNSAFTFFYAKGGYGQWFDIKNVIAHGSSGAFSTLKGLISTGGGRTHKIINNVVYDLTQTAGGSQQAYGIYLSDVNNATVLNNTVYNIKNNNGSGSGYGIRIGDYSGHTYQNNIAMDTGGTSSGTIADFSLSSCANATCSYNLSSDATAPGTGSLTNKLASNQFVSLVSGSEDLHLKTGADAIDAGTDLSATFTDDIDGDTRSGTWDIGADETIITNNTPTITSVSDSPDPVAAGADIYFKVDWNDADAGEMVKVLVCTTDAQSGGACSVGSWCTSPVFTNRDPETCSYTTKTADIATQNYYAFVCDDEGACSASTAGTFVVQEKEPTAPTDLLTENMPNPVNIATTTPLFSAVFNDPNVGDIANKYCIEVNTQSDFLGTSMWVSDANSCKIGNTLTNCAAGSRCQGVYYKGAALTLNQTTYYWRTWFWDDSGNKSATSTVANFTMANGSGSSPRGVRLKGERIKGGTRLK